MKKILLTGIAGFIGFHVAQALADQANVIVYGIDNINSYYDVNLKYSRLEALGLERVACDMQMTVHSDRYKNIYFRKTELSDKDTLLALFEAERFDYVIHLAAQAGVRYSLLEPQSYIDSNVTGFLNILECCRAFPVKHLLYASSSSVYGLNTKIPFAETDRVESPASLYAATKKMNESMAYTYAHLFGIPSSGLRFFTVYGEWGRPDMSPFLFVGKILRDEPIDLFNNGKMKRDFTYVQDIVGGILRLMEKPPVSTPGAEIYNIGNNQPVDLLDYVRTIERVVGKTAQIKYLPMQPGDVPMTYASIDKLATVTGFAPTTPLEAGLERFVAWFRAFYQL